MRLSPFAQLRISPTYMAKEFHFLRIEPRLNVNKIQLIHLHLGVTVCPLFHHWHAVFAWDIALVYSFAFFTPQQR